MWHSDVADILIKSMMTQGATSCRVSLLCDKSIQVGTRLCEFEKLEHSDNTSVEVCAFVGKRIAIASGTRTDSEGLSMLAERVVELAKITPENQFLRLPTSEEVYHAEVLDVKDLSLHNNISDMLAFAKECEESAMSVRNVVSSEGAAVAHSIRSIYIKNSDGACGYDEDEQYSASVSAVARSQAGDTEVDYDFSISSTLNGLKSADSLGTEAGRRAACRLGGRKEKSFVGHVVFDNRVSNQLLHYLLNAINGGLVFKKHTFLHDKLNTQVFGDDVNVVDDPFVSGGLRNSLFDSELVACRKMYLVENGILRNWLLNIESASKLSMRTNGRARGIGSVGPCNACVMNGKHCIDDIIKSIESGVIVTSVMGNGIDIASGNYSQGISGFKIENGVVSHPIKEMTVAGNMLDIFSRVIFANDLEYRTGIDAPSAFVENMTIAGV